MKRKKQKEILTVVKKKRPWKFLSVKGQDFISHPDGMYAVPVKISHKRILKYKSRLFADFVMLLNKFDFPGRYLDGVAVVNFIPGGPDHGLYLDGIISIACNKTTLEMVLTFMHEAGHHVDAYQDLSEDEGLIDEYEASLLHRRYATDEAEYLAYGVEHFYFSPDTLKLTNPRLFDVIGAFDAKVRKTDFDIFYQD